MKVLYHGRRPQPDVAYPFVADLLDLAQQADLLVLSCPASHETRNLVGKAVLVLERLGPSGYLINVSRGSVVDEPALLEALENRTIAGAGMDVFASEPNLDPRWLRLDNVVLQPHSTSITHETRAAMIDRLSRDLDAYQNKRPFHNAAASSK
jgi:lactate dehydrogenase-like 2-hydroxyacid dehydrogenase